MSFLAFILNSRPARWIAAAFAALAAFLVYGKAKQREGRKEGRREAERVQHERAMNAMEVRRDEEKTVRSEPDGSALDELRRDWSRD